MVCPDTLLDADINSKAAEYLALALESAYAGAWHHDCITNNLKCDKRTLTIFGMSSDMLKTYTDFINCVHPDDRHWLHQKIQEALTSVNHGKYHSEYRIIWPDGSIHSVSAHGKAYFDQFGKPIRFIGVCWDITERKETEMRLRQMQNNLTKTAEINAMGEIASTLAHELNQPLTAISTYAQLYTQNTVQNNYSSNDLLKALQEIAKQATRAGAIIHRIKNLTYKGDLYCEPVDLNNLVQEAIEFIHYDQFNFLPDIQLELSPILPLVSVDKVQIQQVIINLIKNSIEAMQTANTINPYIKISTCLQTKDTVIVTIIDNGPGIPVELHDKIFNLYFTTKPDGMGIGLAICRTIIEAHGGHLSHSPTEISDTGICFQFTLPINC